MKVSRSTLDSENADLQYQGMPGRYSTCTSGIASSLVKDEGVLDFIFNLALQTFPMLARVEIFPFTSEIEGAVKAYKIKAR